jgi:hypothetical protein
MFSVTDSYLNKVDSFYLCADYFTIYLYIFTECVSSSLHVTYTAARKKNFYTLYTYYRFGTLYIFLSVSGKGAMHLHISLLP